VYFIFSHLLISFQRQIIFNLIDLGVDMFLLLTVLIVRVAVYKLFQVYTRVDAYINISSATEL